MHSKNPKFRPLNPHRGTVQNSIEFIIMKYGWKPDLPDFRDKKFLFEVLDVLPESVDLRDDMPPIYDQQALGSCSANALSGAIEYDQTKNKMASVFIPSRLFIYYQERSIENTIDSDSGAMLRDGIKACNTFGVCPEDLWSYDIGKFTQNPTKEAYDSAINHKIVSYRTVEQDLNSLQTALASGYPIIFGITVYSSLEGAQVAQTGIVPMPDPSENCLGGHAILLCGYNNATKLFTFRNSWGNWGDKGYGYLSYDYVLNPGLASDFWLISSVE